MDNVKDRKDRENEFESAFINQYLNITAPPRQIKPTKHWSIGDLIANRYKIFNIKRGGMGIVYLCYDNKACEPVAIKTYIEDEEYYRETIERFRSEALTWVKLGKHRNIVQAKYVLNIEDRPYIFMELIRSEDDESPSLKNLLKKGKLNHDQCIDFAIQFCSGMIHATAKIPGMIHRDIKPENILITPDGTLKVSDFGLTKVFYNVSNLGTFKGSASHSSPEQCLGLAMMDISSDIYSFGLVLYEMFTGRYPFKIEIHKSEKETEDKLKIQHLIEIPENPRSIEPELPEKLNNIIMKCLEKKPENRYHDFKELKGALLTYCKLPIKSDEIKASSPNFRALEAQYFVNKGISMTTFGRYREAISLFDAAIKTNPHNIEALSRKGIALIGMGKYNEASNYFDRYLKVNPYDADVLNHKGSILNLQGKREEAIECFNKALDIHPWCSEALYNKAATLFTMEKYEEAEETLNKIKEKSIGNSYEILMETCLRKTNPYLINNDKINNIETKPGKQKH